MTHVQLDLAEMQHRFMVDDKDCVSLYQALIIARNFAGADSLAQCHPGMHIAAVPAYLPPIALPPVCPRQ